MTEQVRETFDLFEMNDWTVDAAAEKLTSIARDYPGAKITLSVLDRDDEYPVLVASWSREKTADEVEGEERERARHAALREMESLSQDRKAFVKRGLPFPDQARFDELSVFLRRSPPPDAVRIVLED